MALLAQSVPYHNRKHKTPSITDIFPLINIGDPLQFRIPTNCPAAICPTYEYICVPVFETEGYAAVIPGAVVLTCTPSSGCSDVIIFHSVLPMPNSEQSGKSHKEHVSRASASLSTEFKVEFGDVTAVTACIAETYCLHLQGRRLCQES